MKKTLAMVACLLLLAATGSAQAQENREMQLLDCVADARAERAIIGQADYVGEPWVYTWYTTQTWDNDQGQWVDIDTITHQIVVPGERLEVVFEDGAIFTYGAVLNGTNPHLWGDNLSSLKKYGMGDREGPYIAIMETDGLIYLLNLKSDGTCGVGWYLKQPE